MKKAIFLMFDTLICYKENNKDFRDFYIDKTYIDVIKKAVDTDYSVCILINDESITKIYYSDTDYSYMLRLLKAKIRQLINKIDLSFTILNSNRFINTESIPNPITLYRLAVENKLSLRDSIIIGNNINLMDYAYNAGIGTYIDEKELFYEK